MHRDIEKEMAIVHETFLRRSRAKKEEIEHIVYTHIISKYQVPIQELTLQELTLDMVLIEEISFEGFFNLPNSFKEVHGILYWENWLPDKMKKRAFCIWSSEKSDNLYFLPDEKIPRETFYFEGLLWNGGKTKLNVLKKFIKDIEERYVGGYKYIVNEATSLYPEKERYKRWFNFAQECVSFIKHSGYWTNCFYALLLTCLFSEYITPVEIP